MDPVRFDRLTKTLVTASTRRRLVGLMTTAPLLGVLPTLLGQESEAAHPAKRLLHRKEQRRRKRRQQLRQRRRNTNRNGKKREKNDLGWSLIKFVSVTAEAQTKVGVPEPWPGMHVDFYYRIKGEGDTWSDLKFSRSADNGSPPATYAPERYAVAAFVQAPELQWSGFVEFRNPLIGAPWASLWRGGTVNNGVYTGGDEWARLGFGVGTSGRISLKTTGAGPSRHPDIVLEVTRLDDTDTHKAFKLVLREGNALDYCGDVAC